MRRSFCSKRVGIWLFVLFVLLQSTMTPTVAQPSNAYMVGYPPVLVTLHFSEFSEIFVRA